MKMRNMKIQNIKLHDMKMLDVKIQLGHGHVCKLHIKFERNGSICIYSIDV